MVLIGAHLVFAYDTELTVLFYFYFSTMAGNLLWYFFLLNRDHINTTHHADSLASDCLQPRLLPILNQQSSEGQLTSRIVFKLGNPRTAIIPASIPT